MGAEEAAGAEASAASRQVHGAAASRAKIWKDQTMSRKTFAQVREEQRVADIREACDRLKSMGLHDAAEKLRRAMTGEWRTSWPFIDETRRSLDG